MNLLKKHWKRLTFGLLGLVVALAAVVVAAPTPALADEADEPVVLTPDVHWFIGRSHDRKPWPNEDGSPLEYTFVVEDDRVDVEFLMEADDSDAPKGYVYWQLFDENGKQVFTAYLMGFGYGYASNGFGFTLDRGTYTQRLTQFGCEGTEVSVCLGAYVDRDVPVFHWPPKAQDVTVGATATGKIDEFSDGGSVGDEPVKRYSKYFEFTLDEPTNVKVDARPYYGQTQLSLMDDDGTILESASSPYDPEQDHYGDFSLDCGRLDAGTHYIRYETVEVPGSDLNDLNNRFNLSVKAGHEMYRLYDPKSGEHLYTADANERDVQAANGWNYEGIAWYAPLKSDYPIYRLYNPATGEHHYARTEQEYVALQKPENGWVSEGLAFYSNDDPEAAGFGGVAVARLFNAKGKGPDAHHYVNISADGMAEFTHLLKNGWTYEGKGWTGMSW